MEEASQKLRLLARFSYFLQKNLPGHALEELDKFFDQFILLKKASTLGRNVDPSNPSNLSAMLELYSLCQDCLLYFKCLKEVNEDKQNS
jgi:hypothetical protein